MPTVLRIGPYRFFFYASDWHEPRHIHVERDESKAKFWLDPVRFERSTGFGAAELNRIQRMIAEHSDHIRRSWDEYFAG